MDHRGCILVIQRAKRKSVNNVRPMKIYNGQTSTTSTKARDSVANNDHQSANINQKEKNHGTSCRLVVSYFIPEQKKKIAPRRVPF